MSSSGKEAVADQEVSQESIDAFDEKLAAAREQVRHDAEIDDFNEPDSVDEQIPADDTAPVGEEPQQEVVADIQEDYPEPEFDDYLLRAAGISAEEAAEQFGDQEALEAAVRMLDQRFIAEQERFSVQSTPQPEPVQEPEPPQQVQYEPRQQPSPQQQPTGEDFQMPQLEEGDWDEDTVRLVESINKYHRGQYAQRDQELHQLRFAVQQIYEERQRQAHEEYTRFFDNYVNGLGEDWKELFGEGSVHEIQQNQIALRNRQTLDQTAQYLQNALASRGQQVDREELLGRALRVAFPKQQEKVLENKVKSKVSKRRKMFTNRPTHRRTAGKTGVSNEERAARRADQVLRESGLTRDYDDVGSFDNEV